MKKFFYFRSRVFRRIFLVVLLCALLPIGGLTTLTYYNVRSQLTADTAKRLHHASKNIGMAVISRLNDIEASLEQAAKEQPSPSADNQEQGFVTGLTEDTFLSIQRFPADSAELQRFFSLSQKANERIRQGQPLIIEAGKAQKPEIWMAKLIVTANHQKVVVCGHINPDALLEFMLVFVPPNAQVTIVDKSLHPLFNSEFTPDVSYKMLQMEEGAEHRYAEVEQNASEWLVGNWSVFLRAKFDVDSWYVLVAEPKEQVFSGLYQFARNAGLTGGLAFWIILLASSILVRKILLPLQTLQQATQLVGSGKYDCNLDVKSQDEFEDLSNSFNLMAGKIKTHLFQQEKMSKTISDVLGEIGQNEIVLKLLNGLEGLIKAEQVGFVVYEQNARPNSKLWQTTAKSGYVAEKSMALALNPTDLTQKHSEESQFLSTGDLPQLFKLFTAKGCHHFLLLPVNISSEKQGALIFAYPEPKLAPGEIDILHQLADQLGVALAKAAMVEELDGLNFGILTALARSVDAHSKWTLGHSERVTRYALVIGEEMGLDEATLLDVHRAGLLHDLGKISVPSEILNKADKLNPEEIAIIREHPSVAARILEPIKVFDSIRPVVEQHHECWDGSGYPLGLKGEEIHPISRILTVADVYDALYSDRPYREGWSQDRVFEHMTQKSGHLFDPTVVEALFRAMKKVDAQPAEWARSLNAAVV